MNSFLRFYLFCFLNECAMKAFRFQKKLNICVYLLGGGAHRCQGVSMEIRGQSLTIGSLLTSCGFHRLNSGHYTRRKMALTAKPYCQPQDF